MSDTSSNSSNGKDKKKINFSTDYMVSELKNSDKLVAEDKIVHFERQKQSEKMFKIEENGDDESMSEYINGGGASDFDNKNANDNKNDNKNDYKNDYKSENIPNFSNDNQNTINNKKNDDENEEDIDDYNELSESQKRRKRMGLLRELGEIVSTRGIKLTKMYGVESNYFEMKYELEYHRGIINKSKAVSWMSGLLFTCVDGIEIFSESYGSSYGIHIKGWKEKMNSEVNDYYDVLGELYTKYNTTGKSFSPEMRLVFMILSSALAVQMEHMNPIKPKSTNISVDEMRRKAKNDRENNNITLNNKITKEHDRAQQEMEEYRQLKLFEEQEQIKKREFERMKQDFERHEKAEYTQNKSNMNEDYRQEEIRKQLSVLRQNVSKINNNEKPMPDYTKKTSNITQNKIVIEDDSLDLSLNEQDEKIEMIEQNDKLSKTSDDSKNNSKTSKNKSMYSRKSYKRSGGITIKTK